MAFNCKGLYVSFKTRYFENLKNSPKVVEPAPEKVIEPPAETFLYAGKMRSPEGIERRKAADALKKKNNAAQKRKKYAESPEYREKKRKDQEAYNVANKERLRLASAARYHKNKAARNAARKLQRIAAREQTLAYQRKHYQDNREYYLEQIKRNKLKLNPTIGFTKLLRDFAAGRVGFDELAGKYGQAIAQLDDRLSNQKAKFRRNKNPLG